MKSEIQCAIWGSGQSGHRMRDIIASHIQDAEVVCYVDRDYKKLNLDESPQIISAHRLKMLTEEGKIDRILIPGYARLTLSDIMDELYDIGIDPKLLYYVNLDDFEEWCKEKQSLQAVFDMENSKIPYIGSLEYEVSHFCNLNCKRCDHFSNLAPKGSFADPKSFERDLTQISKFVENICELKLLGGEPLLNEDLPLFIEAARRVFPRAAIYIFTNALILRNISKSLIDCIRKNDIVVTFTVYPPMFGQIDDVVMFLRREGLKFAIYHEVKDFAAWINLNGDSDPRKAQRACFSGECHCFKDGMLFKCTQALNTDVFNEKYNQKLPQEYLDLYDETLTASKVREFLTASNALCRYCGPYKWYGWEQTGKDSDLSEWITDQKF